MTESSGRRIQVGLGHGMRLGVRPICAFLLVGVAPGCTDDRGPPAVSDIGDRTLVWEGEAADTIPARMIARQRALFEAILRGDGATAALYLQQRYIWSALHVQLNHRSEPLARWGFKPHLSYWSILAGTVPPELEQLPGRYEFASVDAANAVVTASSPGSGTRLVTRWQRASGEWRAVATEVWIPREAGVGKS